ncbi:MAG: aldose 1-epimerase family protein [Pirellulales bacterium]
MAVKSAVWTDVPAGVYVEQAEWGPAEAGGKQAGWSVKKKRLRGGLSDGVDVVHVDNGRLSFTVLPTRGMSLWKAWVGGEMLGWQSPVHGPVHPSFVPLMEPGGLGWLDGFDELLVRCGLESNGAPEFDEETGRLKYPLHGRIGNKPAQRVGVSFDDATGEISVSGVVEETRFHFLKLRLTTTITTRVGESAIRIRDVIENRSASDAEAQLLYHINFGEPLLDAGARFVAPVKTVVPRNDHSAKGITNWHSYAAPQPAFPEEVYFLEVLGDAQGRTRTLLKNAHGTKGVSVLYNVQQLPCYSLWKNTTASIDGSVTGLEPGTNFPNPRSFEGKKGRVAKLAPGGSVAYDVALEVHTTADQVAAAEQAIAHLQASVKPTLHAAPQEDWCAP